MSWRRATCLPFPHAGGIRSLAADGDRIVVDVEDLEPLHTDLVINATGPPTTFSTTRSVLLRNLLERGLIAPDDTDMRVRVDADHTVLTDAGERSPWLLALGPILRGTYWETIAVPELRGQARRVAQTVLGNVFDDEREGQLQLEYMI